MLVLLFNVFGDCLGPIVHHLAHSFDETQVHHHHHHDHDGHHHHHPQEHDHGLLVSVLLSAFDLNTSHDPGQDNQFLSVKMMSIHGLLPVIISGPNFLRTLLTPIPIGRKWLIGISEIDVLIPPPKS
jgi:hypothetical protein